jgi:DNA-3-methyladenine glycosylase I
LYQAYHDREWGVPLHDDRRLFEFLILEGAQAGLSWLTILRKRENYRAAFHGFDIARVARYGEADTARLLADPGIVRNRLKINAAIRIARGVLDPRGRTVARRFSVALCGRRTRQNAWDRPEQVPARTHSRIC